MQWRLNAESRDDAGFTLIEAVVALVIIFGLMIVLLRTFDSGSRVLVETRRQHAASVFASELIERATALEWSNIGLAVTNNGSDCLAGQVGCPDYLAEFGGTLANGALGWEFNGERLVFNAGDSFRPFLDFHEAVDRDGTVFDRYLFVTSVPEPSDPTVEAYRRITAIVRWTPPTGFREEVQLTSLVAEFQTPSQPLIDGSVTLRTGTLSVEGTVTRLVPFSVDPSGFKTEELKAAPIVYPTAFVNAASNYVASAQARVSSLSAVMVKPGADGVIGTADDVVGQSVIAEDSKYADDDASSDNVPQQAPFDVKLQSDLGISYPGLLADYFVSDLDSSGVPTVVYAETEARARYITDDELPFAFAVANGPTSTVVGMLQEYSLADLATTAYPDPQPQFFLAQTRGRPGSDSYDFRGQADRVDDSFRNRQVSVDYSWSSGPVGLLYDSVAHAYTPEGTPNDFHGWVYATFPSISGTNLAAGESAPLTHLPTFDGDLTVKFWNPDTEDYVEVWPEESSFGSYEDFSCAAGATAETYYLDDGIYDGGADTTPGSLPAEWSITTEDPNLEYEVSGSVTIRPWCFSIVTPDPTLVNEAKFQTAGPIIEAVLNYRVVDTVLGIELQDLLVVYEGDYLEATAVFIEPDA